ncbi:hypothetical protein ACHAWF_016076 [Thalassiosira exigua]
MTMACYDDAEEMLQDQGLEVVVIPYCPSPPPKPPHPSNRRRNFLRPADDGGDAVGGRAGPRPSPASSEAKACDYGDGVVNGVASPPPKPLPFTPRSQSAIAEASGQKTIETAPTTPLHPLSEGGADGAKPPTEKKGDKRSRHKKTATAGTTRSHSDVGPHASGDGSSAVEAGAASSARTPARIRSKSTPPRPAAGPRDSSSSSDGRGSKPPRDPTKKMGLYQMAKLGYQELCNAIIRPPRSDYPLEALGPEEFDFCGRTFLRRDFGVANERGLMVECSIWKRAHDEGEEVAGTIGDVSESRIHDSDEEEGGDGDAHGHLTLNVDDWDENKESGQMYLHVPETFDDDDETDDDESCDGDDGDGGGAEEKPRRRRQDDDGGDGGGDRGRAKSGTIHFTRTKSELSAHSYYRGSIKTRKRRRGPVVIYLHGNSSGRTEVLPYLSHLLGLGVSVVAFDFAGSGKSEGEYVSLGYYEREDLQTVVHHLRASGDVSTIALWGRSMGAATAIMYGSRDPTISGMILDSSFTDLTSLAEEMVEKGKEQGVNVPNFVVSVALRMIKGSIKSQAGFSIRRISPISHVERCFVPAMFVAGEHDDFISKRHSEALHAKYAGAKNLVVVDGDHNSPRPGFLLQSACLFLRSCLHLPPDAELAAPPGTNLLLPPWIRPAPALLRRAHLAAAMRRARGQASSISESQSTDGSWPPPGDKRAAAPGKGRGPAGTSRDDLSVGRREDPPGPGPSLSQDGARSRSVPISPTAAEVAGAPELPDMTERQKEIQSSLFKMLGQQE